MTKAINLCQSVSCNYQNKQRLYSKANGSLLLKDQYEILKKQWRRGAINSRPPWCCLLYLVRFCSSKIDNPTYTYNSINIIIELKWRKLCFLQDSGSIPLMKNSSLIISVTKFLISTSPQGLLLMLILISVNLGTSQVSIHT